MILYGYEISIVGDVSTQYPSPQVALFEGEQRKPGSHSIFSLHLQRLEEMIGQVRPKICKRKKKVSKF